MKKEKLLCFRQKSWVNPFTQITKMATFKYRYLYSLKSLPFKLEHQQKLFRGLFFLPKINKEKFHIFDKNHGLTPLKRIQKWSLLKIDISIVKKAFLLT